MQIENFNFPVFESDESPLCAQTDPEMFYPEEIGIAYGNGNLKSVYRYEREAKAVCRQCPLQEACLRFALENREQGIWGGTTENDRKRLRTILRTRKI
jgi:WhiB family redox-sensing transcriptional regulator